MAEPGPLTRRYVLVRGRVQGVGFRWFVMELATALGLSGWVRNREDGTVEAEAEGELRALEEFVRRLREGNPAAKVAEIESQTAAPQGGRGFEIRR
jgi:acylphosphatase